MENNKFITSWQEAHTIVDNAMKKGDRWPDEESLRAAYEQGKISYNDYRTKIGLGVVKP